MIGKIISNVMLSSQRGGLYDMSIECPEIAHSALPGQFVYIKCGEALTLRRPISIFNAADGIVRICYEVRGKGTDWLSALKSGDEVDIMGPIGHGYTFYEGKRALLCGGGIGIYPLLMIGAKYGADATAALGFRCAEAVNSIGVFESAGIDVKIATDDGSAGHHGFAVDIVRAELEGGGYDVLYCCGPKVMMRAAAELAREAGVICEVSMEERMGCGIGACEACVCEVKAADGSGYKRVCVDGPVFSAEEIVW